MSKPHARNLIIILGDQLSHDITSLQDFDVQQDAIWMCEVREEATYVKHHKKKIAFLFSAMRHFAHELREKGFKIHYTYYHDADNAGSFDGEVGRAIEYFSPEKIIVTAPGEYRVWESIKNWEKKFNIPVKVRKDDRFFSTVKEFVEWGEDYKTLRMENFYRHMRKKHNILIDGDDPVGGQWNFDKENRKPPKEDMNPPSPYMAQIDDITKECMNLVAEEFSDHFGDLEPFYFAVTRDQALYALDKFINERLPKFGTYQDAMVEGKPWMFHAHLSFYLNCGLLSAREVVEKAEKAYHDGHAPINAVEGFIRQILGWREYIRGVYWSQMPDYADKNALNSRRDLPSFFWDAKTDMNCLKQCVGETYQNAYAHHIQRLMIIGNFCLLAGLDVKQVNEWYLLVYADAYEWVEMPNVTGMILYADDGLLGSKPYAASASYINKMSDYCKNCAYDPNDREGEKACPFNYLYWDFFMRHEEKFKSNHRLGFTYSNLAKMDDDLKSLLREKAEKFLSSL